MTTKIKKISILNDFSKHPIGRDAGDGPDNGERFRKEFLIPSFNEYDIIEIDLGGILSYGSSFLEESFGGLISKEGMNSSDVKDRLRFVYDDPVHKLDHDEILQYIDEA